jgi:hypothetical protein
MDIEIYQKSQRYNIKAERNLRFNKPAAGSGNLPGQGNQK